MKVLKRNQIIILVMSLMLITAGYLNFTANHENIETSAISDRSDETIGDAQLVSTIPVEDEQNKVENLINGDVSDNNEKHEEENESKQEDLTPTSSTIDTSGSGNEKQDDYYFTTSKLDRNTMYSETLETYQEMYNNQNATADQKSEALKKINNISSTKNAIMIAENLILAKGFDDVVIFVNEESVSVVVKTEELKEEQVAQVQNIVSRELNVGVEKIHISNK